MIFVKRHDIRIAAPPGIQNYSQSDEGSVVVFGNLLAAMLQKMITSASPTIGSYTLRLAPHYGVSFRPEVAVATGVEEPEVAFRFVHRKLSTNGMVRRPKPFGV
jgi:hypothetical protein